MGCFVRASHRLIISDTAVPVLIVDDDEPTQNLLRALLRRCGYRAEVAENGAEAIARLKVNRYAVVVLDVMMPGLGGNDVVEFLRTTSNPVPVIICSAAGPAALTGFDPAVVKAIVRKPFDIDQFTAAVTSVAETCELRPLRVLIIDDDTCARYAMSAFLDGAIVSEVERGDAVLDQVAERPDVVLLDLILPGTPGEEVLRRLRAHDLTRTIPIIVVTSRMLDGSQRERLLADGAAAALYKGELSRETLRVAIDQALGRA